MMFYAQNIRNINVIFLPIDNMGLAPFTLLVVSGQCGWGRVPLLQRVTPATLFIYLLGYH